MNLNRFSGPSNFLPALKAFFKDLKVPMNYVADEPTTAKEILKDTYKDNDTFQLMDDVYFVGMVDDAAFEGNKSLDAEKIKSDYDGILIFGVTLKSRPNGLLPTRSQLAEISRAFNREFYYTPVVVVFKYGNYLAFANTERLKYKQEWREGEKAGKVSLLRDIHIEKPHSGHERILAELQIPTTGTKKVDSFAKLYAYWQEVFSVSLLNKKFYQELSNWYFWATQHVTFPGEPTIADAHHKKAKLEDLLQEHRATNVIRMLTRLLFVWFIKEKKLIPEELFELDALQKDILNEISPYHERGMFKERNKESIYYKAILQNLFFATLNCPIEADSLDKRKRGFRGDGYGTHRGIDYLMRYKSYFKNPDAFLEKLNQTVPFLNGGLFECLDDKFNNIYIDGFSDQMTKGEQLIVPDYLFFGVEEETDLNDIVGIKDKKYKQAAVKGLINILKSYKFTITENTPIEEDVALDPELLGKVFENLLASYNPETKTTARKQTGSFYTPREIVNYMVDESLIAYLKNAISDWGGLDDETLDKELHVLTSFDSKVPFDDNPQLQKEIITALSSCTILDPACGSGAFPMGILQKMVHILQKLDPENKIWKEVQLEKARKESEAAFEIEDKQAREERLLEINEAFDQSINDPDYARKLFLIENCIYGVDIQPIAVQISKLRFFISLVVEQKVNAEKDNFGIRPLPNLETKFVAANTLIGIKKDGGLFETDEVKKLENELKIVRHKIFSLKSKERKIAWREKDEELREKLSAVLKNQGLPLDAAEKLAKWDPYDQNASSPFFDSEWMFGIKEGFDVVIGNPPYASAVTMARSNELKSLYKKLYPLATGSYDIFVLFLYRTIEILNKRGVYSWIIPNKFLIADYAAKTKKYLIDSGLKYSIDVSSFNVFENASVYPIVILGDCSKTKNDFRERLLDKYTDLQERIFKEPVKLVKHDLIEDFGFKLASGATGFEAQKIKELLSEVEDTNSLPFAVSGSIDRYSVTNTNLRFMGLKLDRAFVKKSDSIAGSKWNFWKKPKIVIAGMTKEIEAVFVNKPLGLGVGVYAIYDWGQFDPYLVTAILNSEYLTYYLKIKFKDKHLAGGYLAINKSTLEKLPLIQSSNILPFRILSQILHFNSDSKQSRNIKLVLDSMVLELFFSRHMKERDIDVLEFVEQDINEVMQGREFEKLSDAEKEQVIEALHAKWSHPDNEVVKRMAMFKEKSPDILKPILES